jgi:formylmethanofuran dehydrogenase subunit E
MDLKLHIIKQYTDDYSQRLRLSIAVVDLAKSKMYPINYVCTLPIYFRRGKDETAFERLFKEKSVEQAKTLLTEALMTTNDFEVRVELERRLNLLEPKKISEIKCSGCGKLFLPRRVRRFKSNFCEECMKKKFGSRQ